MGRWRISVGLHHITEFYLVEKTGCKNHRQPITVGICLMSVKVWIKENSWLAKMAAAKLKAEQAAIVFNRTIHLHNTTRAEFLGNRRWVCHELKHVEQYARLGTFRFVIAYLYDFLKNGYTRNRFEIEARNSETDYSLLQKTEFIA